MMPRVCGECGWWREKFLGDEPWGGRCKYPVPVCWILIAGGDSCPREKDADRKSVV